VNRPAEPRRRFLTNHKRRFYRNIEFSRTPTAWLYFRFLRFIRFYRRNAASAKPESLAIKRFFVFIEFSRTPTAWL
jgi:hypothetical protein